MTRTSVSKAGICHFNKVQIPPFDAKGDESWWIRKPYNDQYVKFAMETVNKSFIRSSDRRTLPHSAPQSQNAVPVYFTSKQILPFGFARQQ